MTESTAESEFPTVLRAFRERAGLSQSALARRAGLDPSFINRLESGARGAERRIVESLAAALDLSPVEVDRLFVAGGYLPSRLPPAFARIGFEDPTIEIVASLLANDRLTAEERDEFRQVIALLARQWRRLANGTIREDR